ncbi:MAG: ABC transporter permease, partial [Actinomycetota bacterium]
MRVTLEERIAPRWFTGVLAVVGLTITFAITSIFMLSSGAEPLSAYRQFLVEPLSYRYGVMEVLVSSTPLLLTGAAVVFAFRAGYWNIGVEGQLLCGAIAAAGVGMVVGGMPKPLALILMIGAGMAAGAAWALIPALLRVRFGIDEVVTTLLLNPVALLLVSGLLNGPWRDPVSGFPESERIAASAEFPLLADRSRLHMGFLVALIVILLGWFISTRTAVGVKLRAVGINPAAARFAGLGVERMLLVAALVSGAIAGLAGVSEVAGIQFRLTEGISPGYGYTGIVVAT